MYSSWPKYLQEVKRQQLALDALASSLDPCPALRYGKLLQVMESLARARSEAILEAGVFKCDLIMSYQRAGILTILHSFPVSETELPRHAEADSKKCLQLGKSIPWNLEGL